MTHVVAALKSGADSDCTRCRLRCDTHLARLMRCATAVPKFSGESARPVAGWLRAGRAIAFTLGIAVVGCAAPREVEDIQYDERFDRTRLDLYLPDESGAHPAVMLIHGGAWSAGDKSQMARTGRRLASSGYVAASINYRLLPEGQFPRVFQDAACALAFLQGSASEFGIDPARIAVMGYSAGGHLTALLGVAWDDPDIAPDCAAGLPASPAALVPGAGVFDFRGKDHSITRDLLGGTEAEVPERYVQASPLTHVRPGLPPFLLITGGADWFVGTDDTREMAASLRANGNSAELLTLAGGGHLLNPGVDPGEIQIGTSLETPEAWLALVDFLERTLGKP